MCDKEFSKWLQSYVTNRVRSDYISRCQRVEDDLDIKLDDEFAKDKGKSLLEKLTYTREDQAHNKPLKCEIHFEDGANIYNGMASLKTAIKKYFEFCENNSE